MKANNKECGLYDKFNISRVDGRDAPGGDRHGADYFVLDTTFDPFALPALIAYANACRAEYPLLAADLDGKISALRQVRAEVQIAGSEYITVPGRTLCNGVVVPEFKVMAYPAAMGEAGVPVSVPDLKPWVNVSYYRAKEVSEKAGLGLLRESQAIALVHDIIEQDENWTGGKVGEGRLYGGLHKDSVSGPQAGDYEPTDPEERTWYVLSSGQRIYHWSGNVCEWIFDDLHGDENGIIAERFEKGDPSITCPYSPMEKGIGWYPEAGDDWSGDAPVRGGNWSDGAGAGAFYLNSYTPTSTGYNSVGFRCTRP